jgi:hypothetical protein
MSSAPPSTSSAAALPVAAAADDGNSATPTSSLADRLTIVITTSAIPMHPSTEVLDLLLHSCNLMSELAGVKIVLMCDYPKQILPTPKPSSSSEAAARSWDDNVYKRGVLTRDRFERYQEYIANVRKKYGERADMTIVELTEYHGFAWAVREALETHVKTPYVLIGQHDYIFTMRVPIAELVHAMVESETPTTTKTLAENSDSNSVIPPFALPASIRYVSFVHKSCQNYLHVSERGMPSTVRDHPLHRTFDVASSASSPPLRLCPLLFHYDKHHLASVAYYRDVVLRHPRMVSHAGVFVEDEYGVEQIEDIRRNGMDAWSKYGSYLFYSDERGVKIALRHIHGRRFEQQHIGGLARYMPPGAPSESEHKSDEDEAAGEEATT